MRNILYPNLKIQATKNFTTKNPVRGQTPIKEPEANNEITSFLKAGDQLSNKARDFLQVLAELHVKHKSTVKGETQNPETTGRIQEYITKCTEELDQLHANLEAQLQANSSDEKLQLFKVEDRVLDKLMQLPNPIFMVGLISEADAGVLRLALWEAAGKPSGDAVREFRDEDRSTWTLEELEKKSIVQLAELQGHTNQTYRCPFDQFLNILPLDEHMCNNVFPLRETFFALDKSALTVTDKCLTFRLRSSVFTCGTKLTSLERLRDLQRQLHKDQESTPNRRLHSKSSKESRCAKRREKEERKVFPDIEFLSSPLHAVTLPDASRAKASIPRDAAYYSFCYPQVQDMEQFGRYMHRLKLDLRDPFVAWIMLGAFIYFDYQFDIVGINAVNFGEIRDASKPTSLCLGDPSPVPANCTRTLDEWGRWKPVTSNALIDLGFTHFAWICPSEFIGNYIFPKSGGFAYLHADDRPALPKETREKMEGTRKKTISSDSSDDGDISDEAVTARGEHEGERSDGKKEGAELDNSREMNQENEGDPLHMLQCEKSRFFPVVEDTIMIDGMDACKETGNRKKVNKVTWLKDLRYLPDNEAKKKVVIVQRHINKRLWETPRPLVYDTPLYVDALVNLNRSKGPSEGKFVTVQAQHATFAPGQTAATGLEIALGGQHIRDRVKQAADNSSLPLDDDLDLIYWESQQVDQTMIEDLVKKSAVWIRNNESSEDYAKEVRQNAEYVIKGPAEEV